MSSDLVAPIYKLATETLLAILEFASFHTTWNQFEKRDVQVIDRCTLRSISLVSTEWRQLSAQFHLRILTLDPTSPETPKLLRRFRFDPSLAKYVRSVTISRENESSEGGYYSDGGPCSSCYEGGGEWTSTYERDDPSFTWRKVLTWAGHFPNLKRLHISHVSGEGEGRDRSAWLAETIERESWATLPVPAGAFSSVTTFYASVQIDLSMVWWILRGMERLEWLFLQSGSGSRSVRGSAAGAVPSTAVPSFPECHPKLKHLRLEESKITKEQFHKLISTATSLVTLDCRSTPHLKLDDVALAVSRCPDLKSLSWMTNGMQSAEALAQVIETSRLAHLDLRPWPTDVNLVHALPPSLETLALIEDSQISAIVSVQDQLPLLKTVTSQVDRTRGWQGWAAAQAQSPTPEAAAALREEIELKHEAEPFRGVSNNPFLKLQQQQQQQGGRPQPVIRRSTSLAQDLQIVQHPVATSLSAPADDPLALTPLRAHYLKRELVTLQFIDELKSLDSPSALSFLGPPFLPKARFANGVPQPAPLAGTQAAQDEARSDEASADLPFLRFIFHHFVLSFPFLVNCPPTFFSHKLQPFVYSLVSRNLSNSDEREEDTKRKKIAGKLEKHLGLIMSAAVKVTENGGREEVVRIEDDGLAHSAVPASQQAQFGGGTARPVGSPSLQPKEDASFSINVVTVRNFVVKGRVRNKTHEEFIIRTRRKGNPDVFVARRYGDFTRLAETLRKECLEQDVKTPPPKDRRSTEAKAAPSPTTSSPLASTDDLSSDSPTYDMTHMPSLARERNRLTLRAYLRTILVNPVLASSGAFQSFLLESPVQLTPSEVRDVEIREEMDRIREEEARSFRAEVEGRVAELEGYLRGFREELIKSDGLSRVFATIRHTADVQDLPIEYRKVMEWARISLASTIYQLFLGSDNSSSVFSQLKTIHGMMPYLMLRGILKISNPVAMVRSVLDLFLARPFGSTSLLQKMFSNGLADEARELKEDADMVARKIADDRLVQKVQNFVDAPKATQDIFRAEARAENLDIMSVILRSSSEPSLDRAAFQRVQRASVAYTEYKHFRDELSDPEDDEGPDNDDAWLFEDLHVLMRVLTKARDKEQLVELIFEGSTSELLKDIVTIFYEPLAKVYKAANIADSLSDLQVFLNDLIKTVEHAEDANLVDPQRTVQTFVDLVARHENRFYHFVHQVHSKGEGLFDNLMKWIELFINFVRDGLPSPVSLEYLLPHAGQARADVLAEVDSIIEYHRKLKSAHHERMRKRLNKGAASEADSDAAFVSGVMANLQISSVMGDVEEVAAGDSDEEVDDYDGRDDRGSSSDEEDGPEDATAARPQARVPGGLVPIPNSPGRRGGKKDRVPIEPPKLKLVPLLTLPFVEMVRGPLVAARKQAVANAPKPLR